MAVSQLVSAYVDQELSEAEVQGLRAHITNCKSCEALVEEFLLISQLTRKSFLEISAPERMETRVMQQIGSAQRARQSFRLMWLVALSAVVMTGLAFTGGLAALWGLTTTLMLHFAHGIAVLLLGLVVGRAGLIIGSIVACGVVTVLSVLAIRRLMSMPLETGMGS